MGRMKIKKGLNIPIKGKPEQKIYDAEKPGKVALIGYDYVGMKPTMAVAVGDRVKLGQLLFTDKKMPEVKYTSPGSGKVISINRGAKRVFESMVIELEGSEEITFDAYGEKDLAGLDREKIKNILIDSGMWTSLRERPFGKTANPSVVPYSLFVNVMDTNPLAPDMSVVLAGREKDFQNGLTILSKLTDGQVYLCKHTGADIPNVELDTLRVEEFSGPHPAGLSGTHVHFLDPVNREKKVWTINAQDTVAIGKLFTTGKIDVERVVALTGPGAKNPRLLKTRVGALLNDILKDEIFEGDLRVVSGSILDGRSCENCLSFLGKYHQQITVLKEGRQRQFLGWLYPGWNLYSVKRVLTSALTPKRELAFTTSSEGGERAIIPIGSYEKVMPLDILPTIFLRSLMAGDVEELEKLGILELVEEDLALCTFVSPAKIDYGEELRKILTLIEKEG